ncbi:fatty acyl-CoA reductase 1-like [Liolophura sinensis]|uniref:fatty acyl-CoA reductase 1-like n=1 Tax=Liolophura sinensis TaxID=3198878 RepID=UPI00315852B6
MSSISVPEFYKNRCIFITGGTGFLGKALLEKLLRSCPEVRCIYVMIRPKRGKDIHERLEALLDTSLFDKVRTEQPGFENKVIAIGGDILDDNLGITEEDQQTLVENVSIIFHSAATVKFDEELKLSIQMNVLGVRKILKLAHKIKKLEALVHVSTAYANCDKEQIAEAVYPPPLQPHKLINAVEWMDDEVITTLTPKLTKPRPNTYTYTKSMAEYLLTEERGDIPVAIVRPSIVGATWLEPVPGWVDNFNGPTGLLAAIGKGVLRIMKGDFHGTSDIIPVDIAVKLLIAAAWYTAVERPKDVKVYNGTTGQINRFTWGEMERMSHQYFLKNPVNSMARLPNPRFTKNAFWHDLNVFFDHIIPAYCMDLYLRIAGRKPIFVKVQDRLQKAVKSLDYFTSNQWNFANDNFHMLLNKLSPEDRQIFNFDPRMIQWSLYMENYCLGTKKFVLKEELSELPAARRALARLKKITLVFNTILAIVIWRVLVGRVRVARDLWNLVLRWTSYILMKLPRAFKSSSASA